jgi:inorganic triphosphatase YgiF
METELKFILSPEARERIERHLQGSAGVTAVEDALSTYFDTADHALQKHGLSLRLRQTGNGFLQTVKSAGSGTFQRQEWEWPVHAPEVDRDRLAEVAGLATLTNDRLHPLFRTEVKRTRLDLRPAADTRIELALDEGKIVAGDSSEPLSELELELKAGSEEWLLREALNLLQVAPLALLNESKAERGYHLIDGSGPVAHKAPDVECDPGFSPAEAFHKLSAAIVDHLLCNQPATLRGDEQEGVHQMRIAIRRLRSLLVLFEPFLEVHARERFEEELRRLGRVLGEARDWDVFVAESLPHAVKDEAEFGWTEPLRDLAVQRRDAAHQAAKKAVLEPSFARFVLAFQAWSRHDTGAFDPDEIDQPLKRIAPAALSRLAHKVEKRLAESDPDDAESLHRLRKSAKKLRYGIEFLRGLYGRKASPYYKRCNAMQKRLGKLNDLASLTRLATKLTGDGRVDLVPALGILANRSETLQAKVQDGLDRDFRRFRREDRFWR